MRTLLKISIPADAGNTAVANGSLPKILGEAIERLKPEAAYFALDNGMRTALFVIDLENAADMPMIVEPFFMGFNAVVTMTPVMNQDDLKLGLGKLPQRA